MIQIPRLAINVKTSTHAVCFRCGIELSEYKADLNGSRLCNDCKPVKRNMGDGRCNPWLGEVDDDFNPMTKDGKMYLPGTRTCGHKDCVRKAHIIFDAVKVVEIAPVIAEVVALEPKPAVKLPSKTPVKASRERKRARPVQKPTPAIETTFEQELEAERYDLSYRTGVRMTYEELVQSVQLERYKPRSAQS